MFRKGRMKITVAKVFKIPQNSMAPEPISQSYLVELSVSCFCYSQSYSYHYYCKDPGVKLKSGRVGYEGLNFKL